MEALRKRIADLNSKNIFNLNKLPKLFSKIIVLFYIALGLT